MSSDNTTSCFLRAKTGSLECFSKVVVVVVVVTLWPVRIKDKQPAINAHSLPIFATHHIQKVINWSCVKTKPYFFRPDLPS
jgi:hypothetical protein